MTITRAINSDNDWTFGKGKQNYLSDEDALAQNIKTRLQSFVNDCYFDLTAGVDWFKYLGSKSVLALRNAITRVILETTGVQTLTSLSFDVGEDRKLTISYTVTSLWSKTVTSSTTVG